MRARQLWVGTSIAVVACVAVGCSDPAQVGTPATQVPTQPVPTAAIQRGSPPADTLRWSIEGTTDIASLDPKDAGDNASVTVVNFIFGGLVRLDANLEVAPNDADTWDASADGKTYTFHLRDGLTDASGARVTASDYVRSLNRVIQPGSGGYNAAEQLGRIVGVAEVAAGRATVASGIQALDAQTLQIALTTPSAVFLQQMAFPAAVMVPQRLAATEKAWLHAYGTGPYRVSEWKRGESITLDANERYWQGKPGISHIVIRFSADSMAAYQRYLGGQLDVMGSIQNPLPTAMIFATNTAPDFRTSNALSTHYVGFNNRQAPFDNDHVRRAFALALDKPALVRDVLHGEAAVASRILPPKMLGTSITVSPLQFDPAAARAELAEAGFADGKGLPPLTLTYAPEGGENTVVVQWMQQQWRQNLGVEVRLEALDSSALGKRMDETWKTPEKGLQMYYSIWMADYPDPQNFLSLQLASTSPNNNGHFSDPSFDRLVAEADALASRGQINRRLLLYNQAEQIAIDRVGWLPIIHTQAHILLNPRVQGAVLTPNGLVVADWSKLTLAAVP